MVISEERELIYSQLISESSNTPLLEIIQESIPNNNRILLKIEYANPVGSIHMRVYPYVFKQAEELGFLKPNLTPVIEASLGNAAAAFVYCANILGYNKPFLPKVIVPENISLERLKLLKNLDAEVIFSPSELYNIGYVNILESKINLAKERWINNLKIEPARLYPVTKTRKNARLAYFNLVDEVFEECKRLKIEFVDYFVGIVGSGTSISGISERLKELNPNSLTIASETAEFPNTTSLLNSGKPLPLEKVPKNFPPLTAIGVPLEKLNLRTDLIDEIVPYELNELDRITDVIFKKHKIQIGKSTAGAISSALTLSRQIKSKCILVCAYDERKKWN